MYLYLYLYLSSMVIRSAAGQIGQNLADENRKLGKNLSVAFGYKSALVMANHRWSWGLRSTKWSNYFVVDLDKFHPRS